LCAPPRSQTAAAARREHPDIDDREVVAALNGFDAVWSSLFPAEPARIVGLLVERITIDTSGIAVDLRHEGLGSVLRDLITPRHEEARA
jgi:site-specific DNA recombinase